MTEREFVQTRGLKKSTRHTCLATIAGERCPHRGKYRTWMYDKEYNMQDHVSYWRTGHGFLPYRSPDVIVWQPYNFYQEELDKIRAEYPNLQVEVLGEGWWNKGTHLIVFSKMENNRMDKGKGGKNGKSEE